MSSSFDVDSLVPAYVRYLVSFNTLNVHHTCMSEIAYAPFVVQLYLLLNMSFGL